MSCLNPPSGESALYTTADKRHKGEIKLAARKLRRAEKAWFTIPGIVIRLLIVDTSSLS